MYSLNDFREKINDIARPYHWKCTFDGGCFAPLQDRERVTASMRTAALPGLTINEVAISYFGMTYKLGGTPTYEPLAAQFIIDADYEVLTEWKRVLDEVFQYNEQNGPQWQAPTVYMGTITLEQLNTNREIASQYKLSMAYLSAIGAISYGHETKDTPLVFDATITYSFYNKQ